MIAIHNIQVNKTTISDGHSLAAYITSASDTLITNTTIGAKEALDVLDSSSHLDGSAYAAGVDFLSSMGVVDDSGNWVPLTLDAAGNLPVSATVDFAGDYAEDSAHISGDIGLFQLAVRRDTRAVGSDTDGDYSSFNVNAVGELWVKDADALAQLVLINADTTAILADTANIDTNIAAILADTANIDTNIAAILADTANIDTNVASILSEVAALSHAEDSVHSSGHMGTMPLAVRNDVLASLVDADGDYAPLQVDADGALYVTGSVSVQGANIAILQQQVAVSSTAAQVPAANLADRKTLMLQNNSGSSIWIGSATVTTSGATTGIELPKSSFLELEVGPDVDVYAIKAGAGTLDLNVLELA